MSTLTLREILTYHALESVVFARLTSLGQNPHSARNITTLWMWLERIGFQNLVATIRSATEDRLIHYVNEAEAILDVLHQDAPPPADDRGTLPLSVATMRHDLQPVGLRFFYANRDVVIQGLTEIMDGIGRVIFDEGLRGLMDANPGSEVLSRRFEKSVGNSPEHVRTMFIRFDRGHPLETDMIAQYFTSRWGGCLDKVVVEATRPGVAPMYGRVVFWTASYLDLALNRQQQTEFIVDGKRFWGLRTIANVGHRS